MLIGSWVIDINCPWNLELGVVLWQGLCVSIGVVLALNFVGGKTGLDVGQCFLTGWRGELKA